MNGYLGVLKNYAGFKGRARRKEYWVFTLFNIIFAMLAMILDNVLGIAIEGAAFGPIYGLYTLAIFIPSLAVSVRRLHDIGKSGKMLLIVLIPGLGVIWLIALMLLDGNSEENQYGANPKKADDGELISDEATGNTLLPLIVIWMFVSKLFWTLMPKLNENYFIEEWFKSVSAFMTLIWAIIPIGLAFALKDKSKQMLLFILGGIYLIYGLYEINILFIE